MDSPGCSLHSQLDQIKCIRILVSLNKCLWSKSFIQLKFFLWKCVNWMEGKYLFHKIKSLNRIQEPDRTHLNMLQICYVTCTCEELAHLVHLFTDQMLIFSDVTGCVMANHTDIGDHQLGKWKSTRLITLCQFECVHLLIIFICILLHSELNFNLYFFCRPIQRPD